MLDWDFLHRDVLEKCFSDFGGAGKDEFAFGPLRQERRSEDVPLVSIVIMLQDPVHCLRNIFHYQIQKEFVSTCCRKETVLQADHVWVIH